MIFCVSIFNFFNNVKEFRGLFSGVYGVNGILTFDIVCMDEIIATFVTCYKHYNYARFSKRTLRVVRNR